jgi:hypothetical protein
VPLEDLGINDDIKDAGAVHVVFQSEEYAYLRFQGSQLWHQKVVRQGGIPDKAEPGDHYGWALAAADFGLGRRGDDLAIGVPGEDLGSRRDAGAVNVLYRSSRLNLLTAEHAQFWHQGSAGMRGRPETGDQFAYALTAGDFGFGGPADLAVGVPEEGIERRSRKDAKAAGGVNILTGTFSAGLSARYSLFESQDNAGFDGAVEGDSETVDRFGHSLSSGDFGLGPGTDLAVGVPGEGKESRFSRKRRVGAVNVLYTDHINGIRASDDQFWWQASDLLHDKAEETDEFGKALAR